MVQTIKSHIAFNYSHPRMLHQRSPGFPISSTELSTPAPGGARVQLGEGDEKMLHDLDVLEGAADLQGEAPKGESMKQNGTGSVSKTPHT